MGRDRQDIVDQVPDWFLARRRKEPTGRPADARNSYKRTSHRKSAAPLPLAA